MNTNDTKYQAPALDKGLDIMEYLSLKAKPLSQTDIATGIGKKPNEIYRMLVCLESRGYLIREEVSGKYRLSLKLYHLSHRHSPVDEVRRAAQHPMDELASSIHQSCHLGVLYLEQLMVISQSRSPGPIALSVEEGRLFPLLMTASGRTLLAFMQEEERMRLLENNQLYKKQSSKQQQKFLQSLEEIRENGYYVKPSDSTKGVTDISAPVGNSETGAIAALTVSALTTQLDNETVSSDKIIGNVRTTAMKILEGLGLK